MVAYECYRHTLWLKTPCTSFLKLSWLTLPTKQSGETQGLTGYVILNIVKCVASHLLVKNTEDWEKVIEEQKFKEVPAMPIGKNTTHCHCVGTAKTIVL